MLSILETIGKNVEEATNVSEVLKFSGLDFKVNVENCYYMYNGQPELVPGVLANVREDTGEILGVVSNRYRILQNEDAFDFVNYISDDIKFKKAGMTYNGMIYIIAEMEPKKYLGEDYRNYVVFRNSHNGKYPLQATISPMRVACENQFNSIFRKVDNNVYIKHLSGFESKLKMAKQVLKGYAQTVSELEHKLNTYATTPFSQEQFSMFVNTVFPITNEMSDGVANKQDEKRNVLNYAYKYDDNQNFRGTLLGALNATTYYDSHAVEFFGKRTNTIDARFIKLLDGVQLTNKLLEYVL